MLYYVDKLPNFIDIGEEAENIAVDVSFDLTAWVEMHGPGAAQLLVQRPQDTNPYPAVTTTADDVLTWQPTQTDTAFAGRGKIQLLYSTADEVLEKSPIIYIMTGDSLEGAGDPPEPYEDWIDTLTDLASETLINAQAAANSADAAEDAKDAAVIAQGKAEDAQEAAEIAQGKAEDAQTAAESAQTAIEDMTVTASVDANVGTPSVDVTKTEIGGVVNIDLDFHNLKGADGTSPVGAITDVRVAGTSVVTDNVANIPYASTTDPGVIKVNADYGVALAGTSKFPYINAAVTGGIQPGSSAYRPIVPKYQHEATFFGLSKAAGVDLANETVTLGTYPETAKTAIKTMLGVPDDAGEIAYDDSETYPADTVGSEISAVKSALSDTAPVIVDSASGAIASFPDGTARPVVGLSVGVEPVQDLHGYDHPWPAGGGVNLLQLTGRTIVTSDTFSNTSPRDFSTPKAYIGITNRNYFNNANVTSYSITDGSVTVNSASSGYGVGLTVACSPETQYTLTYDNAALSVIGIGFYASDGSFLVELNITQVSQWTFTTPANCTNLIVVFAPAVGSAVTFNHPILVEGATAPASWTPYSNICPITGHTGTVVTRTGVQLFDEVWELGGIVTATGENTSAQDCYRAKNYIPVVPGSSVYRSWDTAASGSVYLLWFAYKADKTLSRYIGAQSGPDKIDLNSDEWFLRFYAYGRTQSVPKMMINFGVTSSAYETYTPLNLHVSWESEAGTVYGGEVDVLTGKLTVTRGFITYNGTENWSTGTVGGYSVFTVARGAVKQACGFISNYITRVTALNSSDNIGYYGSSNFNVKMTAFSTLADFQAALSITPMVVAHELATPLEFDLTASQLETLFGQNNVWATSGNTEVTYRADTKLYIDKKLAALAAQIVNS